VAGDRGRGVERVYSNHNGKGIEKNIAIKHSAQGPERPPHAPRRSDLYRRALERRKWRDLEKKITLTSRDCAGRQEISNIRLRSIRAHANAK